MYLFGGAVFAGCLLGSLDVLFSCVPPTPSPFILEIIFSCDHIVCWHQWPFQLAEDRNGSHPLGSLALCCLSVALLSCFPLGCLLSWWHSILILVSWSIWTVFAILFPPLISHVIQTFLPFLKLSQIWLSKCLEISYLSLPVTHAKACLSLGALSTLHNEAGAATFLVLAAPWGTYCTSLCTGGSLTLYWGFLNAFNKVFFSFLADLAYFLLGLSRGIL